MISFRVFKIPFYVSVYAVRELSVAIIPNDSILSCSIFEVSNVCQKYSDPQILHGFFLSNQHGLVFPLAEMVN